jgi:hypothetical protein
MRKYLGFGVLFFVFGCATSTHQTPSESGPWVAPVPSETGTNIDTTALRNRLGLDRPAEKLGFEEKAFETCQVGYGFPRDRNCQKKHLVVIHFQLMCRDSEGTTSVIQTAEDMLPVSQRSVRWSLKDLSSTVQTDSQGYGQITVIAPSPQAQQRLKLAVGNDFLYIRAKEITRIATPPSWCDRTSAQR